MRKFYVVALFLIGGMFISNQVQAQAPVKKNIVKINPLSLGLLTLNGSYERVVSDNASLQLGIFYTGFSISGTSFSGLGITPEVRIYLSGSKDAPEGLHVSPFLRYQSFSLSSSPIDGENISADLSSFGGGCLLGYQWLLGRSDRVSLDLFAGPKYSSSKIETQGTASEEDFEGMGNFGGVGLRGGLTLGIAF